MVRRSRRALALPLVLALAAPAGAQRLPFRSYGVRDGLPHGRVNQILQDRHGYLWFGTWEGLARFDGQRFVAYGTEDGLPNPVIDDLAEDGQGRLWVATHGGGVARLLDSRPAGPGGPAFAAQSLGAGPEADHVFSLRFDQAGALWCGTQVGFFSAAETPAGELQAQPRLLDQDAPHGALVFLGRSGGACLMTRGGVTRAVGAAPEPAPAGAEHGELIEVEQGGPGRWLVAFERALFELREPQDGGPLQWTLLPLELGPQQSIQALAADADVLWIGTNQGLIRRSQAGDVLLTTAQGLADDWVRCLALDRDGSLWIGTHAGEVCKLSRSPITSYGRSEGMAATEVLRVVETPAGRIFASTDGGGLFELLGERVARVPGTERAPFDRVHLRILCDRRGDWWLGTDEGLFFVPGPEPDVARARRLGEADGVPERPIFSEVREDELGRIWLAQDGPPTVLCLEPRPAGGWEVQRFALDATGQAARCFLRDRRGGMWLGTFDVLARLESGAFRPLAGCPGLPAPVVRPRCLFEDARGSLWVGLRFGGVSVSDAPEADPPRFVNFGHPEGLASETVWSVAEDGAGKIYLATSRGLVRLDRDTGSMRQYTSSEGLAGDVVNHLLRDRQGDLWAGTSGGLSRLDVDVAEERARPPPVFLERVLAAGEELPVPGRGTRSLSGVVLGPGPRNLTIGYVGLDFLGSRPLRYQYELQGIDAAWRAPTEQREVHYVGLAPGAYRFRVRAVGGDGVLSEQPAVLEFRVLAPLWRRGWFVALLGAAVVLGMLALHRWRIRQALAMERIRTQIATDLHDDVGSGLSQIAILSEVARREVGPDAARILGEQAELARSLRESMGEIVWAIDPHRDRLPDLVHRLRQVASELCSEPELALAFAAPPDEVIEAVGLTPNQRRHLLLFFKEALTNVVRHARASSVDVRIELALGRLRLSVRDDGVGFDAAGAPAGPGGRRGHGLASLARRAAELGGRLRLDSAPGRGTWIELDVPAGARRLFGKGPA